MKKSEKQSILDKSISITWCVEDVYEHAKRIGKKLTIKQAEEVLEMLDKNHQADVGINWDVISDTISIYKQN